MTDDGREPRPSHDSLSSVSTTSLVFDRLQQEMEKAPDQRKTGGGGRLPPPGAADRYKPEGDDDDALDESGPFLGEPGAPPLERKPMDRGLRRVLVIVAAVMAAAWLVALAVYLASGSYKHASDADHDPDAQARGSGKAITLDQVLSGYWLPESQSIRWIADPDGRDGLLLETGAAGKDYLVVEDVRAGGDGGNASAAADAAAPDAAPLARSRTLMKSQLFEYGGRQMRPDWLEPSPDLQKVLLAVDKKKVWRHSFTATYFILDVASGRVEPLVGGRDDARVQFAGWSPTSEAVSFTMDNNLYFRRLGAGDTAAVQITTDGGPEYFYGNPDWVYEEEVVGGRTATWWSADGRYLAFLRTNETAVKEFPIDYYLSRPSGTKPAEGDEAYPEVRQIKYPKPGSHNPVVDVLFYDVAGRDVFSVAAAGEFPPADRIVINVLWAGGAQVLVKETNRVGDHVKVMLVDAARRSAAVVSDVDVAALDGGWHEINHKAVYVPADAARGRPHDGYIDTVIHDNFEHLAYFAPLNSSRPTMLTAGEWEVEEAPSAVDLAGNLVYFVATRESSTQRHVYSVRLDGSDLRPLTDTSADGYYAASFSAGAGFALLTYQGPRVPYQKVVSTPSTAARYERTVEDNAALAERARRHQLPVERLGTLDLGGGVVVNYKERRPPHFDPRRRHPVLFHQYSGPGSQSVTRRFAVDFQSYAAAALGYVVVVVDPRGTGFRGRAHRVAVRSRLGLLEARDHIAAARHFASLPYVDPARLAIWGWSYGGFAALKTLEQDAGATFGYGMAVAPVTDWRFYDSVYTERYMRLPADNAAGYAASRVANASALGAATRFLLVHGAADDNVHLQNSLHLLDDLDRAGVRNYDVHLFPDSDHSISFHNANRIVYYKLRDWLVNAFNGEWLKTKDPEPIGRLRARFVAARRALWPRP